MSIFDVFKINEIKRENAQLHELLKKINANDAIEVQNRINDLKIDNEKLLKNIKDQKEMIEQLSKTINQKKKEIIVLDNEILFESFSLYKPKFKFQNSDEYKNRLDQIRDQQKELIRSGRAAVGNQNWVVNNSKSEGKKMVNDMIKLLLRSFNNECDYCVDNVKFNNIESEKNRIEKSYETINKLGRIAQITISENYKDLKINELYLAFEYMRKKQEEKEEQKRIREELREQQKLEQEIKIARDKILKERKHFNLAIKDLKMKFDLSSEEKEKNEIKEKLNSMNEQLEELNKDEKVIDYREKNAKAGYVYIISNIGSFGKNVYKIGMTRRLEPYDRIDELSDASVPFSFDVHAMVFSDNAPDLEAKLHQYFYNNRLNKINNRKEFFYADILVIEKIIKENYDKIVDVIKDPPAEDYRESLLIK